MSETPEVVYRAAAEANVRTLLANDRTSWTPEQLDETARLHAQMPSFRAAVDAAYAAGHEIGYGVGYNQGRIDEAMGVRVEDQDD